MAPDDLQIRLDAGRSVSGLLLMPSEPVVCLILAHGASAGMTHPFIAAVADGHADRRCSATFGMVASIHLIVAEQATPIRASLMLHISRGAIGLAARGYPAPCLEGTGSSPHDGGQASTRACSRPVGRWRRTTLPYCP